MGPRSIQVCAFVYACITRVSPFAIAGRSCAYCHIVRRAILALRTHLVRSGSGCWSRQVLGVTSCALFNASRASAETKTCGKETWSKDQRQGQRGGQQQRCKCGHEYLAGRSRVRVLIQVPSQTFSSSQFRRRRCQQGERQGTHL
jgi:hypothetical protein